MVSEYTGAYGELSALGIKYGINRNTVKIYLDRAGKEVKIIRKWTKNTRYMLREEGERWIPPTPQ